MAKKKAGFFARQLILKGIGWAGQAKIMRGKVLVVGLGGLGSPATSGLVRAGVGTVGIVDGDKLEISNLHRQSLYTKKDLGKYKADAAGKYLNSVGANTKIIKYKQWLDENNARKIIKQYDVVLDCCDNFVTRYTLNKICCTLGKPLVHGAVFGWEGEMMTILPSKTACYRCLFPDPPPATALKKRAANGIIGFVPGTIGALQAAEAVKILLGEKGLLTDRLLLFNFLAMKPRVVKIQKKKSCPDCGRRIIKKLT